MEPQTPLAALRTNPGICFSCGFLCRRDVLNTHLSLNYEITREDRNRNNWFRMHDERLIPWCFRGVPIHADIIESCGGLMANRDDYPPAERGPALGKQNEIAEMVIKEDRGCELWFQYQPGLGPEAHLAGRAQKDFEDRERSFRLQLEEGRKQFELALEQQRREFQLTLEAERRAFENRMETDRQVFLRDLAVFYDKLQKGTTKAGLAVAGSALLLALVQILIAYFD